MGQKNEKISGGDGDIFVSNPVFFLSIGYLAVIGIVLTIGATLQKCALILTTFLQLRTVVVFVAAIAEDKAKRRRGRH